MAADNGAVSGDRAGAGREKSEEDVRRSQGQSYDGDGTRGITVFWDGQNGRNNDNVKCHVSYKLLP